MSEHSLENVSLDVTNEHTDLSTIETQIAELKQSVLDYQQEEQTLKDNKKQKLLDEMALKDQEDALEKKKKDLEAKKEIILTALDVELLKKDVDESLQKKAKEYKQEVKSISISGTTLWKLTNWISNHKWHIAIGAGAVAAFARIRSLFKKKNIEDSSDDESENEDSSDDEKTTSEKDTNKEEKDSEDIDSSDDETPDENVVQKVEDSVKKVDEWVKKAKWWRDTITGWLSWFGKK